MSDQTIGLISGTAHVILSLFLALIATYGSFRIIDRLMKDDDHIEALKADNVAMSILLSGILLAVALIVKAATDPAVSTIQVFLFRSFSWIRLLEVGALIAGYVLLAILLANVSIWAAMSVFLRFTRDLDELAEIRRNNVAVAVTIGVIVVIMGLFLSDGLRSLMQALVPFPAFQPVEVLGG